MSNYLPDYNSLFDACDRGRKRALARLPKCRECGDPVTDEYFYDLDGVFFCEECLQRRFRRCTHDFV